jgi:ABC-type glycerol-3-phosphate transport system substrate-binding protein
MNPCPALVAVLVVFATGCGGVESGSSGSSRDATIPDDDRGADALLPDAPLDSLLADTAPDGGGNDAKRDSLLPDAALDGGHPDGATYCLACYVGCDAGFWCAPDERCTSVGTQPSGPQACCPDKGAAAHGDHCHN